MDSEHAEPKSPELLPQLPETMNIVRLIAHLNRASSARMLEKKVDIAIAEKNHEDAEVVKLKNELTEMQKYGNVVDIVQEVEKEMGAITDVGIFLREMQKRIVMHFKESGRKFLDQFIIDTEDFLINNAVAKSDSFKNFLKTIVISSQDIRRRKKEMFEAEQGRLRGMFKKLLTTPDPPETAPDTTPPSS